MRKRAAHALIGVKQRERHPWSGTREKQSTAREETASPLHSRAPSPESRPPQLQATAQPRRHRLRREGCSVGPRAAFPCPHPQAAARAGGRPAGPQGSHRHGRSEAWGVGRGAPAWPPPRAHSPSSAPNRSHRRANSVQHRRQQFREYFAKLLWKQNLAEIRM